MTPDGAATVRHCANCAAEMEGHQDWCLECGTAAPGRLGGLRPGLRAVSATLVLTLLLVGGAGAASYAALSSDANREAIAAAPADAAPVAQAPPAVPAPPAPTIPAPVAPEPVEAPAETPATELPDAPAVETPPAVDSTLAQVTPPSGSTSKPSGSGSTSRADDEKDAPVDDEDTDAGSGDDKPADRKAEPIALAAGSVSLYDPQGRATPAGDPGAAIDGDLETTFSIAAPDDGKPLQVGVVVDLGSVKKVRGVEFTSPTTGGTVEVYAADGSALPPDIADTRWGDPVSRADVGKTERVLLPRGGSTYRYVTLWFTTPPDGETAAGLTELELLG